MHNPPMFMGYSQLEKRLCKIDGNGSSIQVEPPTLKGLIPMPMTTSALRLRKKTGESMPSFKWSANGERPGLAWGAAYFPQSGLFVIPHRGGIP